jgi:hypothetical protein
MSASKLGRDGATPFHTRLRKVGRPPRLKMGTLSLFRIHTLIQQENCSVKNFRAVGHVLPC